MIRNSTRATPQVPGGNARRQPRVDPDPECTKGQGEPWVSTPHACQSRRDVRTWAIFIVPGWNPSHARLPSIHLFPLPQRCHPEEVATATDEGSAVAFSWFPVGTPFHA